MSHPAPVAIVLAALALLLSWTPQSSGQPSAQCPGNWSAWSTQECNCTDENYWSVRECTAANGSTTYLYGLELDIATCRNSCQAAHTNVCACNTMFQAADGSWQCQEYECFLYGYNKTTWSAWTPVTDCGPSYRSREWSCTWAANTSAINGANTSALMNSRTCGERCIGCITADPPLNCTGVCSECANTTFSLVMQDCSSMYSIEIENVTCGSWGGWFSLGSCRLTSTCPNTELPMLKRTRSCIITEADRNASSNACPSSAPSQFDCNACNSSTSPKSALKPSAADPTFQAVAPAKATDLPSLLPSIEKRQVSKPKVEAKQAVVVGSSMCLVFVGFIIFIVAIDAHSIAEEAVNRMGKNLKRACIRKPSSKRH